MSLVVEHNTNVDTGTCHKIQTPIIIIIRISQNFYVSCLFKTP